VITLLCFHFTHTHKMASTSRETEKTTTKAKPKPRPAKKPAKGEWSGRARREKTDDKTLQKADVATGSTGE
jgi:hypothetical protein